MYCSNRSSKTTILVLGFVLTLAASAQGQNSVSSEQPSPSVTILDSTKEGDGLIGSVRRVRVESAKLELESGRLIEGPRQLREVTTYSLEGKRIENVSYPVAGSLVGKEEYRHDDKGNIVEMTLRDKDGSILTREAYDYEFDRFGNWTSMVTSLVLFEAGDWKREPVEVSYRTVTYYFDHTIAEIIEPVSRRTMPPIPSSIAIGSTVLSLDGLPNRIASSDVSAYLLEVIGSSPPEFARSPETLKISQPTLTVGQGSTNTSSVPGKPMAISSAAKVSAAEVTATEITGAKNTGDPTAHKNALDYYRTGRERFDSGDLMGAIEAYQQSIRLEPRSAEVQLSLGQAYLHLERDEDAVKAFKQSIRLNPEMAEAHYGLGLEYFRRSRYKDAADAFRQVTLLRPGLAKAHYGLALAYQELGKQDMLIAEFRILETLDRGLAAKLANTFPEFSLPCRTPPRCR